MTEAQAKEAMTILACDLRGSFGGPDSPFGNFVASGNQWGRFFYSRDLVTRRDPKTPAQLAQRETFHVVGRGWGSLLTNQQRETWNNVHMKKTSKSHDRVTLTGQAAWTHVNAIRQRIGLPLRMLPPSGKDAVTFTLPAARLTPPNTLTLRFAADTWNAPGGGIIVSGTAPPGPGVDSWHIFHAIASFVHPGTLECSVEYPVAVQEGDRVRLRLRASAPSGRQSMIVLQYVVAEQGIYDL